MRGVALALALTSLLGAVEDDRGFEVRHLWPLLEHSRLGDGGQRTMALFFAYHRTTGPDGQTRSQNILNWVRWGPSEARHTWLVPLWLQGPGYAGAPLACAGSWTRDDGGRSTWITPLFHRSTTTAGETRDLHVLNWVQGDGWRTLFPLWFGTDTGWFVPPALSWGGRDDDGGHTWWATPLFHRSTDDQGRQTSLHVGPLLTGRDWWWLAPLVWRGGAPGSKHTGVLPLWMHGPGYWCSPIALSCGGDRSTWITPLFHRRVDATGRTAAMHAGPWFHGPDYDVVFPLGWWFGKPGQRSGGLFPLWFQGDGWWLSPVAMSGQRRDERGASTWITPLYHRSADAADRTTSRHVGPWVDWEGGQALFPLWYRVGGHSGVPLLAHLGPGYRVFPAGLSAWWQDGDGADNLWITPLFHRRRQQRDATTSMHLGPWFQGSDPGGSYRLLFPLFWQRERDGRSHTGLLPVWLAGDDYRIIPPLLSGWGRRDGGGSHLWITPLFHRSVDGAGAVTSAHVLNWIQAGDITTLFPLVWRFGPPEARQTVIPPVWFQGPDRVVVPPALSWWARRDDGGDSLWITPLFHRTRDAQGAITSLHALTWVQRSGQRMLLPFWYSDGTNRALLPLWAGGADWWTVPPALTASWRDAAGNDTLWITPLFHRTTDAQGRTVGMHALNVTHGPDHTAVWPLAWSWGAEGRRHRAILPLWFDGPGYALALPPLWGRFARADGGRSTWVTPLAHVGSDAAGRVTDWHVGNVVAWNGNWMVAPLAWASGPPDRRRRVVLPVYADGDGWWVAPPLLSAGWTGADGARTSLWSPFWHQTVERDGRLRHRHLVNWIDTPEVSTVFPLWWRWSGAAAAQHTLLAPLFYRGTQRDGDTVTSVLPPLYAHRQGSRLDTGIAMQLFPFLTQSADDGHEVNVLWRLFHLRHHRDATEVMVGPLWWSEHRDGHPLAWQVLGGLVANDVDFDRRTERTYAGWFFGVGERSHY
jgi:hypothetical protein